MDNSPLTLKNPVVRELIVFLVSFAGAIGGLILLCSIVAFVLSLAL